MTGYNTRNGPDVLIRANSLVLEVTRRCNMQCDMCLRGDAQCVDMGENVVKATFSAIDCIGTVTPTGGEPLLVPDMTAKVIRMAREKDAASVFLSTNGSVSPFDSGVMPVIKEIATYGPGLWSKGWKNWEKTSEEDFYDCTIQVSVDIYHDEDMACYAEWSMFRNVSFHSGAGGSVINRGNAELNGIGEFDREVKKLSLEAEDCGGNVEIIVQSDIYVNTQGYCFSDCDLSYEQQDDPEALDPDCYLGHISNLRETLTRLAREEYPELFEVEVPEMMAVVA